MQILRVWFKGFDYMYWGTTTLYYKNTQIPSSKLSTIFFVRKNIVLEFKSIFNFFYTLKKCLQLNGNFGVDDQQWFNHFVKIIKNELHITCVLWHVTHGMWLVTRGGVWTISQNFSSLTFTILERECFEDIFTKDESLTKLVS